MELGKVLIDQLMNGYLYGKLLAEMHSTYLRRTKKVFYQNPKLCELKNNDGKANRYK